MAPALFAVAAMASVAHAQVTQQISFTAQQITGAWASGGCATTNEKGTSTSGQAATMTWNDTTGASSGTVLQVQIQANWKFWCSGGSYNLAINSTNLGAGGTPTNTNNCSCNAAPFETSTQTITAGSFPWTANGSNSLSFTHSGSSWIGVMDGSGGWSVRITVTLLNGPPNLPTNLHQAGVSGGGPQAPGYVSDPTIWFRGSVTDSDSNDRIGLQAEILPSGTPFGANPTGTLVQTPNASMVDSGQVAEVLLDFTAASLPAGSYHWRVRAVDQAGARSGWVEFSALPVHFTTDFEPPTTPGGPRSPNNVQLVFSAPSGEVDFRWGTATDPGSAVPVNYRIQVAADGNFNQVVFEANVTTPEVTTTLTASLNPYYWQVFAIDQAGNLSAPTPPMIFQVAWMVPVETTDRHANCGAGAAAGAPATMAIAGIAALLGLLGSRRRAA